MSVPSQLPDNGLRSVIDQERSRRDAAQKPPTPEKEKKKVVTWRAAALSIVRVIDGL